MGVRVKNQEARFKRRGREDEEAASSFIRDPLSAISLAADLSEKGPCLFYLSESFEALKERRVGVVEPDSEGVRCGVGEVVGGHFGEGGGEGSGIPGVLFGEVVRFEFVAA